MIIADAMIIDHQRSMIMTWGYEHWSLWSLIMLIHTWMCCSYYDRLLIMGDDMLIIAMNRTVIIHDQRHIHVIMNIIVNPICQVLKKIWCLIFLSSREGGHRETQHWWFKITLDERSVFSIAHYGARSGVWCFGFETSHFFMALGNPGLA